MDKAIALGMVWHTHAGKTTLAGTLPGKDIGELPGAAHPSEPAR